MKNFLLLCFLIVVLNRTNAQSIAYWQQDVDYTIDVRLDTACKCLDGKIRMRYINHAPDTLRYIWFHLWPNAYKNDRTAFSEQMLINRSTEFYFSPTEQKGYINQLAFQVDDQPAKTEDHPLHQDITKLILPAPLLPGESVIIKTPFHLKLPFNFSRGGFVDHSFQLTQWHPKPAVYDAEGWHEMPYLDQGEFYSEFGNYHVRITLPDSMKVAATGQLINVEQNQGEQTLSYSQNKVHDFAWFTDHEFKVLKDTMMLQRRTIHLQAYYYSEFWKKANVMELIKQSVRSKSEWLGEYPYDVVTVVEHKKENSGGMEYPTITLIDRTTDQQALASLINHEIGHNWFYGILASNERAYPWMDEGMNSYYDRRFERAYMDTLLKEKKESQGWFSNVLPANQEQAALDWMISKKRDQPMNLSAEAYSALNYGLIVYNKTADWMELLERKITKPVFDSLMRIYYQQWKFKHPKPADFEKIFMDYDPSLKSHFELLSRQGALEKNEVSRKKIRFKAGFNLKNPPDAHQVFYAPVIGYNHYDKWMAGLSLHNFSMSESRFHFFAAPVFAFGSSTIQGLAKLQYQIPVGENGNRLSLFFNAASFSQNQFRDSTSKLYPLNVRKWVPGMRLSLFSKDKRSARTGYIEWKTFLLQEKTVAFERDTATFQNRFSFPVAASTIHQAELALDDERALYPYHLRLRFEKGKQFFKAGFEGRYFFNYAKGGGLETRLFAGKYFYTTPQTLSGKFETERYHLNLSGSNGYEDYTYSNYFIGRNEFEGWKSHQIMMRDGGFKVRSELLSDKIGKSDDWLMALNLSTSIPKALNPLELLPIRVPIRLFADLGTVSESWTSNSETEKLFYDAGIEIPLLSKAIRIYVPLFSSRSFTNYYKSVFPEKRFWKKISFSIDIQHFRLQSIFPQIPF